MQTTHPMCELQCRYEQKCTGYTYDNVTGVCQLFGNFSCLQFLRLFDENPQEKLRMIDMNFYTFGELK